MPCNSGAPSIKAAPEKQVPGRAKYEQLQRRIRFTEVSKAVADLRYRPAA